MLSRVSDKRREQILFSDGPYRASWVTAVWRAGHCPARPTGGRSSFPVCRGGVVTKCPHHSRHQGDSDYETISTFPLTYLGNSEMCQRESGGDGEEKRPRSWGLRGRTVRYSYIPT